jgi:bifunctional non-homologous end joining protein LigD
VTLTFPVAPMKATLGTMPTSDDGWAYEVKWDGYRTLAFVDDGRVRLQSSNLYDVTHKYPELGDLPGAVASRRAILDGELVVVDDAGRPRFELIQRHERQAAIFLFDVLSIDDHDTIALPYEDRRKLLAELVDAGANWLVPAHRVGDGRALLEATEAQELEGIMAKRLGSTYKPGTRTRDWRKVKHRRRAEVVIGGYSAGSGNRAGAFGALLVGRWVDDRPGGVLTFAGGVGSGFTHRRLDEMSALLRELRTTECPFDPPPPRAYQKGATWVRPERSALIEITEFTNEGFVRQAAFLDLVDDTGGADRQI